MARSVQQNTVRCLNVSLGATRYQWPSSIVIRLQPRMRAEVTRLIASRGRWWGRVDSGNTKARPASQRARPLPAKVAAAATRDQSHA